MDRTAITSPSAGSSTTTARLTTPPVPRIATCGWLMIGVSNRAPRLPVLVSVNVPPASSSGLTWPALVLGVVVDDLPGLGVEHRVQLGVDLEGFERGEGEEGQVGQLDALAGLEVGLGPGAQPGDRGDVRLHHGGELGGDLQRLD